MSSDIDEKFARMVRIQDEAERRNRKEVDFRFRKSQIEMLKKAKRDMKRDMKREKKAS